MNATRSLTRSAKISVYRAPLMIPPQWPTVDPDRAVFPDPTAPTLSRFRPVLRDVLERVAGHRHGAR